MMVLKYHGSIFKPTTETQPESAQFNAIHINTKFPVFPMSRRLALLMAQEHQHELSSF